MSFRGVHPLHISIVLHSAKICTILFHFAKKGGAGGGVGLLGQGSNGPGCPGTYQGTAGQAYAHCGWGGSGGLPQQWGTFVGLGPGSGGGGGNGISGSIGAVRIIWGPNRAFPATNTGDL